MKKIFYILLLCFILNVHARNITIKSANTPQAFLPDGQVITETIRGDLNKDGLEDYVFITKDTLNSRFVKDEFRGFIDRNRRGIMVVFSQQTKYELVFKSKDCFSSENEDGGVYFPPSLNVFIENGNLLIHFAHGRYGYWRYNFRYKSSKFMLVGYDSDEAYGPILLRSVSINLLTKKLLLKENTNPHYRPEKIISKWSNVALKKPITLEDLTDFDAYEVCRFIQLKC